MSIPKTITSMGTGTLEKELNDIEDRLKYFDGEQEKLYRDALRKEALKRGYDVKYVTKRVSYIRLIRKYQ
jgi:hypothetical protein